MKAALFFTLALGSYTSHADIISACELFTADSTVQTPSIQPPTDLDGITKQIGAATQAGRAEFKKVLGAKCKNMASGPGEKGSLQTAAKACVSVCQKNLKMDPSYGISDAINLQCQLSCQSSVAEFQAYRSGFKAGGKSCSTATAVNPDQEMETGSKSMR